MAVEVTSSAQGHDQKLSLLENEKHVLAAKLRSYHDRKQQLAQEYGTSALDGRQEMMLQRVKMLLGELTNLEAHSIKLQAQVQFLEQAQDQAMAPEELLIKRKQYINADIQIQALSKRIADFEIEYAVAKLDESPEDPRFKHKQKVINTLKSQLDSRKNEIGKKTKIHEKNLRKVLAEEDAKTIEIGRKQLNIVDLELDYKHDQEIYDTVCRRIQELRMERKRPARISVAYNADIAGIRDNRVKYTVALIFGATIFGILTPFIRKKASR